MPDSLKLVDEILNQAGIRYALIGGHAVNTWLTPRFTADVDVTVAADATEIARLKQLLEDEGFVVTREFGIDLPSGPDFIAFEKSDAAITLEIQTAKTSFQQNVLDRAITTDDGWRVATPEDLIILKLIAGRTKDRIDLEGLIKLPDLDHRYVKQLAMEWNLLDELRGIERACEG